jgi:hypothetical protein
MKLPPLAAEANKTLRLVTRPTAKILDILFHYPDIELTWRIPKALEKESGYDLMISIAYPYPVHWGCAMALKKNPGICKTWVADCGDPFMGNRAVNHNRPFYFAHLEKWFSRKAHFITVPIEEARGAYFPEFHSKIRVIPQGFNFEEISISKDYIGHEVPTFAYAGQFMPGQRDPTRLLRYLTSVKKDFKCILYARNTSFVQPLINKLGTKVEVRNYISRDKLIKVLRQMDFLVNIENNTHVQLPSKLIDYAVAGRPVLSVSSNSIDTVTVDQFLNGNYANKAALPDLERYDIRNVANQFLALCDSSGETASH